jgi:uncharacterized transporter YbjL
VFLLYGTRFLALFSILSSRGVGGVGVGVGLEGGGVLEPLVWTYTCGSGKLVVSLPQRTLRMLRKFFLDSFTTVDLCV